MAKVTKEDRERHDPNMPMCHLECEVFQWTTIPLTIGKGESLRVPTLTSFPIPKDKNAKNGLQPESAYLFGQDNQQTGECDIMLQDALLHAGYTVEEPLPVGYWIIEFKGRKILEDMWVVHPVYKWEFEWVRVFSVSSQKQALVKGEYSDKEVRDEILRDA